MSLPRLVPLRKIRLRKSQKATIRRMRFEHNRPSGPRHYLMMSPMIYATPIDLTGWDGSFGVIGSIRFHQQGWTPTRLYEGFERYDPNSEKTGL